MRKNKIKLSLIDDYCKIVTIGNFLNNSFPFSQNVEDLTKQIKKTNNSLQDFYENLFVQLHLNDISFLLLRNQLKCNNQLFEIAQKSNFENLNNFLITSHETQQEIIFNLREKLSKLKINCEILI